MPEKPNVYEDPQKRFYSTRATERTVGGVAGIVAMHVGMAAAGIMNNGESPYVFGGSILAGVMGGIALLASVSDRNKADSLD